MRFLETLMKRLDGGRMQVRKAMIGEPYLRVEMGKRLKDLRETASLTQEALAAEMRRSQSSVSAWEVGTATPGLEELEWLATRYKVSVAYLLGVSEGEERPARLDLLSIPVVGEICAGRGNRATEDVRIEDVGRVREVMEVSARRIQRMLRAPNHEVVALVVAGDSMESVFHDGDLILVERLEEMHELKDRDYVVATVDGDEAWVLRLWIEEAKILSPLNLERFDPVPVREGTKVWGRVIYVMRAMGR